MVFSHHTHTLLLLTFCAKAVLHLQSCHCKVMRQQFHFTLNPSVKETGLPIAAPVLQMKKMKSKSPLLKSQRHVIGGVQDNNRRVLESPLPLRGLQSGR